MPSRDGLPSSVSMMISSDPGGGGGGPPPVAGCFNLSTFFLAESEKKAVI